MPGVYMWVEDGAAPTVHIWASLLKCLDGEALPLWFEPHWACRCCRLFGFNCSLQLTCGSFFPSSFIITVDFAASCFFANTDWIVYLFGKQHLNRSASKYFFINRTAGTDIFHSLITYFLCGTGTSFIRKVLRLKLDLHGHDCERLTLTYSHKRAENNLAF